MGFGSDFSGYEDIDSQWTFLEGTTQERTAFAHAIARRLTTPRGGLFYSQNYGYDIRQFIGDTIEPSQAESIIEAEVRKDERVIDCDASITVTSKERWTIAIKVMADDNQTFTLTLAVSSVTVDLLGVKQ